MVIEQGPRPIQRRLVHLDDNELALKPDWAQAEALVNFLYSSPDNPWRLDPINHCIVVPQGDFAQSLQQRLSFTDQTESVRQFLSKSSGVRIIGWSPYAGITLYEIDKQLGDYIVFINSYNYHERHAFHDLIFALGCEGAGRETPSGQIDFETVDDAVNSLAPEIHRLHREWLERHAPATPDK